MLNNHSLITSLNMTPATDTELNKIIKYIGSHTDYKQYQYGITDNMFFSLINGQWYISHLPFKSPHSNILILPKYKRVAEVDKFREKRIGCLKLNLHIFFNKDDEENIKEIASQRAFYKTKEHKNGDNNNNQKRITHGTLGEFGWQLFLNTKIVDGSKPSYDSREFDIPDVNSCNIGVKSSQDGFMSFIAEPRLSISQLTTIIPTKIYHKNDCVVLGGLIKKEKWNKLDNENPNFMIDDALLSKHIKYNTKTGFGFDFEDFMPVYGIEDIDNTYSGLPSQNFILDKNVNFENINPSLLATIQKIQTTSNSRIMYTHVNSIGLTRLTNNIYEHLSSDNLSVKKLKEIAIKYNIGIVFYDDYTLNKMIRKKVLPYFYNFILDPYCIGTLNTSGNILKQK